MSFLAGWGPILIAAGLAVPPLVLLYFLKLRRRPEPVSSTLLWKRAVEDLQVNAPFQRIRNNLLLWLQLLVLVLAALALGKPVLQAQRHDEDTVLVLIDQSASMSVEERPGHSRLDEACDQARTLISNLPRGSRAMVIGFADRATVVSPFDTDQAALRERIGSIEQTQSATTLSEALTLAEAYLQNLVIGGPEKGTDIEIRSTSGPARAVILTDGNVADAERLTVQRLPADKMEVVCIGARADNVGVVSLDARRNYEHPERLQVFAVVRNFGPAAVNVDAGLYINGEHVDVQTLELQPGRAAGEAGEAGEAGDASAPEEPAADESSPADAASPGLAGPGSGSGGPGGRYAALRAPAPGSVASVAFDDINYEGGGIVEIRLAVDDALICDNRAWTVVQPPRHVSVLLVSAGNLFLERLLPTLPIRLEVLTPAEYESAAEDRISLDERSRFDAVIFDNHSTGRLPPGNYLFFGGVPQVEGVSADGVVENEVIFNWEESHPVLRYVAVETIQVFRWLRLTLPPGAIPLMQGETSPVMATWSDAGRQYLVCAFGLLVQDEETGQPALNTDWVTKAHFPVFIFNALQHLSASLVPRGEPNVRPGEPLEFPVAPTEETIRIHRPDGVIDAVPAAGLGTVHYARTRRVGVYRAEPGTAGKDQRAVNLFDAGESDVAPAQGLILGGDKLQTAPGVQRVNRPVWPWLLLAMVVVLTLEWAIYSRRIYV